MGKDSLERVGASHGGVKRKAEVVLVGEIVDLLVIDRFVNDSGSDVECRRNRSAIISKMASLRNASWDVAPHDAIG